MKYQISGLHSGQLWIIYSESRATAEHMAALFRKERYANVTVKKLEAD